MVAFFLVVGLGCVRTLMLFEDEPHLVDDTAPPDSGIPDDTSDTDSDDTGNPDTSEPDDTGDTGEPPQTVCVAGSADNFAIPHARWALAVLHASRRYDDLSDSVLSLSPEWFLASAWQRTGFGCAEYDEPWYLSEPWSGPLGCMGIAEDTTWLELMRLYPQYYVSDDYSTLMTGDHIEASVMSLAWATYVNHALMQRLEIDPDEWISASKDPHALERMMALHHFSGPWAWQASDVVKKCPNDIEACLTGETLNHVSGVVEKMQILSDAECYDEPLTTEIVEQYLEELERLWPSEDWSAIRAAALPAVTGEGFAIEAPAVLDAIDSELGVRLRCPETELWNWYLFSCP